MKKIVCIALLAFGFTANAQETDVVSILTNNQIIKTAYESETLTIKEKIEVVNEQVEEGHITENQAYQIISKMMEQNENEVVEIDEDYDYDWGKEQNPFDFAMGVEVDTVVRYKKDVKPYIAFGVGNVATDGAFANSEFGYLRSNYFEWGIGVRVPFNQYNNKWGIRYGLGFKYNGLATTQNQQFVLNGNETVTAPSVEDLKNNTAYFRNTYITIPISLDFTTTSKTYNAANRKFDNKGGVNFGIGGYVGYNINSKQFLRYENADGYKIHERQKGNWNVTDFQYGVTAYAGLDWIKLVFKYDLNPVFKNNPTDQNYWSLGLQ
ncbi:MAG TPA: outer membrane beta-barrel protein, partial [Flavobacterium sp.]|nr:outer membrane beta-barrel protein [Flavobacterium sp.]